VDDKTHELAVLKAQAAIRLEELKAQDSAKEVAGKAIGEDGLLYIFMIVLVGVGASLFLEGEKIAAVMGLLGPFGCFTYCAHSNVKWHCWHCCETRKARV
jgi:hypothetical protein